jgi:hypothetical protein
MIDAMSKLTDVEPNIIDLSPGDDGQAWSEIKNMRMEVDGYNVFWKPRGGALHIHTFPAKVVTTFSFQARVGGTLKTFVAAHCDNGTVYLYDVGAGSRVVIDTGFASTTPIQMHNIGVFVYLFSASDSKRRVYNLNDASVFTWNAAQAKPITAYSWVTGGDFGVENLWGFRNDQPVLKMSNVYTIGSDIATATGGVLAPNTAYRFDFPASHKTIKIGLVEYNNDQIYVNGSRETDFTFGSGTNNPAVYPLIGIPVIDGEIDLSAFRTKIEKLYEDGAVVTDKNQFSQTELHQVSDELPIFPDTPDLASYLGANSRYQYNGTDIIDNPDFVMPVLHRAYALVDVMFDGSVTLIGRPMVVSTGVDAIMSGGLLSRRGVTLTTTAASSTGVLKRVLIATRWQATEDATLTPSSERYPNGQFFIAKDVDANATSVTDFTADRLLIRPLTELLPLAAGVPVIFSRDSIVPGTTASFKGTLLLGGYTVNRQVPRPYTDTANPDDKNVYIENNGAATSLAYKASLLFEYSDGSYSSVYDTSTPYKIATTIAGTPSTATFVINSGGLSNGLAFISINDIIVSASISVVMTDEEVVDALAAALNANSAFSSTWIASSIPGFGFWALVITAKFNTETLNGTYCVLEPSGRFTIVSGIQVTAGGAETSTTPNTAIRFHNMNAEISSVFLLSKADSGGAYRLVGQYPVLDPRANGKAITPPGSDSDHAALPAYTVPTANRILESVYLQNFIATCVPAQNPRFDTQAPAVSNGEIMAVIPMSYDTERNSVLRYRVVVLTNQDVQVGYLVEQATATGIIYQADLEVIDSDTQALRRYGSTRILDTVYFQSNLGLSSVTGATVKLVVERERYSLFTGAVESMTYNKRHGELWVQFDAGGTLLIIDITSGEVRQDTYGGPFDVTSLAWSDTSLVGTIGPDLMTLDDDSAFDDALDALTGTVASNAWTFGSIGTPFTISDGTTTVSVTTISAGVDTTAVIAGKIVTAINASGAFKARAYADGAVVRFAPKTACTLSFSAEAQFTLSATPFTLAKTIYRMSALSKPLTTQLEHLKILELSLMGQAVSCIPSFDFQRPRLESIAGAWSKTFTAELTESSKALTMAGASWQIHRRGIKPRILLTFTPSSGAFVETIRLKAEGTQNIAKARQ